MNRHRPAVLASTGFLLTSAFHVSSSVRAAAGPAIRFHLAEKSRVSLAVYDRQGALVRELLRGESLAAGGHAIEWDGLDRHGVLLPGGTYEWRLLETPGFRSRFVTTLGINPPSGLAGHFPRNWVGDHTGAGTVCVDPTGVYIGSRLTEGLMQTLKQSHDAKTRLWQRPQYYDGGRMTRMAANGRFAFLIQPDGNLRKLDAGTGRHLAVWKILWDDEPASDVDVHGDDLVVCYPEHGAVRWLDIRNGAPRREVGGLGNPRALTVRDGGEALVLTDDGVLSLTRRRTTPVNRIDVEGHDFVAVDADHGTGEIYVVDRHEGERILKYGRDGRLIRSYGGATRPFGRYQPLLFSGVTDVAADGRGGFYVTEPTAPPRRTAHFDGGTGRLIREWYGGQSFYVHAAVDRDDPTSVWGCAGEGFIHHYRMDYDRGTWTIRAVYRVGRLGDSLYPFSVKWMPLRRRGVLYLLCASVPAVVRVDEEGGRIVPVAIASYAHSGPRTFFMFPGSGEKGFPEPWAAAARHCGWRDLDKAPRHYYWGDANANGEMEPDEFRFFERRGDLKIGSMGCYDRELNFRKPQAGPGDPAAFYMLPRTGWIGPGGNVPVWSWDRTRKTGRVPEDTTDWPSVRSMAADDDGNLYAAIQSGLMIREHGQYEGGRWPCQSIKRARLAKWSCDGRLRFSVGRHSKTPDEINTGVLYYPMQIVLGPRDTVVVSDQIYQPGTVWTRDGLYAGSFYDRRADDGLPDGIYRAHSDDMQGIELAELVDGRVFWFQSVQGMVLVYEVRGWRSLRRRGGRVLRPPEARAAKLDGTGLSATYFRDPDGEAVALRATEAPIYFEPFGRPHREDLPPPPWRVVWEGHIEPRVSDRYTFHAIRAKDERVTIALDGQETYVSAASGTRARPVELRAATPHRLRIDFVNGSGRPEIRVLWSGRALDRQRLDAAQLYPLAGPE